MKKLLLGLGSIASVVAPVAAVISCGDDSKTTTGTQVHTVTMTGQALTRVKEGLALLGIDKTKVKAVVAGENLNLATDATHSINFAHYTKTTFSADTKIDLDGGTTATVKAGDTLVIGTPAAQRRASQAPATKVILMTKDATGKAVNKDLTSDVQSKMQVVNENIVQVTATAITASKPGIHVEAVEEKDSTHAAVSLMVVGGDLPTHLDKAKHIQPAMDKLSKLDNIATITSITFMVVKLDAELNMTGKTFAVTVAAGKANDIEAIATAAATVTGVDIQMPGSTPDGGTGSGGSGSTGGTGTAPATAIDLTNGDMATWHGLFHTPGAGTARTLPTVGAVLEVTVNSHKLTHTWTAADNTALAGYTATTQTMHQDDVVNYLARIFSTENAGNTANDIKAAFGISSATSTSHAHPFTNTVPTGSTAGQANVALDLGASNGVMTWTTLLPKIKSATGFGTATKSIAITIDSKTLTLTLTAGTSDQNLIDAMNAALTGATGFAGCFDTSK